jgi:hypothetical protein
VAEDTHRVAQGLLVVVEGMEIREAEVGKKAMVVEVGTSATMVVVDPILSKVVRVVQLEVEVEVILGMIPKTMIISLLVVCFVLHLVVLTMGPVVIAIIKGSTDIMSVGILEAMEKNFGIMNAGTLAIRMVAMLIRGKMIQPMA